MAFSWWAQRGSEGIYRHSAAVGAFLEISKYRSSVRIQGATLSNQHTRMHCRSAQKSNFNFIFFCFFDNWWWKMCMTDETFKSDRENIFLRSRNKKNSATSSRKKFFAVVAKKKSAQTRPSGFGMEQASARHVNIFFYQLMLLGIMRASIDIRRTCSTHKK